MTPFEIAFRDRIALLRRYGPDDLRRVLEAPDALILLLNDTARAAVSNPDDSAEPHGVSPRLGAPSRSDN